MYKIPMQCFLEAKLKDKTLSSKQIVEYTLMFLMVESNLVEQAKQLGLTILDKDPLHRLKLINIVFLDIYNEKVTSLLNERLKADFHEYKEYIAKF